MREKRWKNEEKKLVGKVERKGRWSDHFNFRYVTFKTQMKDTIADLLSNFSFY